MMTWLRALDWRRVLIYTHRWLGIAGGVIFVTWFVSGVVMMYARMPRLTGEERLMRLPPLDLSAVRVPPAEAAASAELSPERLRISMLGDRPVYRFLSRDAWTAIYADTGQPVQGLSAEEALAVVRRFVPEHASTVRYDAHLLDSDQWTLSAVIRAHMPTHRIGLGDAEDTYLYVSDRTGEAVMKTTGSQRRWAYWGAVLHWIYFTPFRRQADFWTQSIIWASIVGCVMCLSGLVWGIWRYSPFSRYRLKRVRSHSPYAGMMAWHHYAGLIFGLVTFTWILSGGLSLNPWSWSPGTSPTRQQREGMAGGPLDLDQLTPARMRAAVAAIIPSFTPKEFDVVQLQGEPFLVAYRAPSADHADEWTNTDLTAFLSPVTRLDLRLVSGVAPAHGTFTRFDDRVVLAAARAAMPGAAVEDVVWLREYDAYYYDRHNARPLPVIRVRYGDPQRTWLYLDPRLGVIVRKEERLSRVNRWLYHGLHSLDFPFLYYRRPLWDVVVILLSVGGIVLSATTITVAWHRLRRHAHRLQSAPDRQLSARSAHSSRVERAAKSNLS